MAVVLYVDRICISLALPRMGRDLGIPAESLGWMGFAYWLSYAAFEIPSGRMGDRLGPRRVLARIVVWWSAFTALTGAAVGFRTLFLTRLLFGAGEAGGFPNASTAVSRWFPARSRATAMGAIQGAGQAGGALSPLLVIPIQQSFGWRASFVVFAFAGVAWAAAWYAWFRDAPTRDGGVSTEELQEISGNPARAHDVLPWRRAWRSTSLRGLVLTWFAMGYSNSFIGFWMPSYLTTTRGFTEADLRWTSLSWTALLLGSALGGRVSDVAVVRMGRARGRRAVAFVALAGCALGFAGTTIAHGKAEVVAVVAFAALSGGMFAANLLATCIDVGERHAGTVTAVVNTGGQLSAALSTVAFGYLQKVTGSYEAPILVIAVVLAAGLVPWRFIDASRLVEAEPPAANARGVKSGARPRARARWRSWLRD